MAFPEPIWQSLKIGAKTCLYRPLARQSTFITAPWIESRNRVKYCVQTLGDLLLPLCSSGDHALVVCLEEKTTFLAECDYGSMLGGVTDY